MNNNIAVCVATNYILDSENIQEWCEHYFALGFNKIYLMDDTLNQIYKLSSISYIEEKIKNGDIIYNEFDHTLQQKLYDTFYSQHKNEFSWCAFFDSDEFLILHKHNSIQDFLNDTSLNFNNADVIHVAWKMFGDNGYLYRPQGKTIDLYTKESIKKYNRIETKIIVRGGLNNCHFVIGHTAVNGNNYQRRVFCNGVKYDRQSTSPLSYDDCFHTPDYSIASLNHYYTRSTLEFACRKSLGRLDKPEETWDVSLLFFKKLYFEHNEFTPEKEKIFLGVHNILKSSKDIVARRYSLKNSNSYSLFDNENEKIIVTMTSWKKRINNVATVLKTITQQTLIPDLIIVNLSTQEFPNHEQDLPQDLLSLLDNKIKINWIDWDNQKQWKKIIPTFINYPTDVIICIDDDRLYPFDFIEKLYNKHLEFPLNPITVNSGYKVNNMLQHCGHGTLNKAAFYGDMLSVLDDEIYNIQSSDTCFTFFANRAGHPILAVNNELDTNIKIFNEIEPLNVANGTSDSNMHKKTMKFLNNKFGINTVDIELYQTYYKDGQIQPFAFPDFVHIQNTNNGYEHAELNPFWSEFMFMYHIWKHNDLPDIIGFEQYDIHFPYHLIVPEIKKGNILFYDKLTLSGNIITHYKNCHKNEYLDEALKIIEETYGKDNPYIKAAKNKQFYYKSCFVMNKDTFKKLGDFMFPILEKLDKSHNLNFDINQYKTTFSSLNTRTFGFVAERLISLFLSVNIPAEKIILTKNIKTENKTYNTVNHGLQPFKRYTINHTVPSQTTLVRRKPQFRNKTHFSHSF